MFTTKCVALAFIGSAAAFNPAMQLSAGRRAAIAGAGAAAVAAPLLRPTEADAAVYPGSMKGNPQAPFLTFFDARAGCNRGGSEYKGEKSNSPDDDMCVKLQMKTVSASPADNVLASVLNQLDGNTAVASSGASSSSAKASAASGSNSSPAPAAAAPKKKGLFGF
mmetsp:Transcript_4689/g.10360  ORF Transcript_4689/g.10360 Transcript_4689/m.10360 type:complete len:165 (+) Transcript_4689:152-646(+)